ncbi:MAG: DUF1573 domain-containing protein [Prevotella sp.]|nr:DUF1573 domain-containing protein [Prevotella sp.]
MITYKLKYALSGCTLLFIFCLLSASCRRQAVTSRVSAAKIEFIGTTEYDFGRYSTRDTVFHYFVYKNVGDVPFVIDSVEPSCHCVQPVYNKRPLPPGGIDSIRMAYDGSGFVPGFFTKRCDIYSNADTVYQLRIRGQYYEEQ